ncbi:CotH kinase family protein [Seonamhaeicola sp. NFXS20]|uniref:CotH kinase family protein n=1 Tax=Seonamhaeicola sp. NFXS20 TaxID=2816959 RepID=UPI003B8C1025
MKVYLLLLSLIYSTTCNSQTLNINISDNKFGIDESLSLIVTQIQNIENYQDIESYNEITITLGENDYSFISVPNSLEYSNSYTIKNINTTNNYTLYFTQLPIILIESDNTIVDEPKVSATLVYTDDEQTVTANIGIELRGGSSQSYPKKTYDIEFWEDETDDDTIDMQFGELREDDDWILDALYNEPLRLRSYTANKLWKQLHTPYFIDDEPEAKSGADVMYVEIFIKGHYNGIYNLSEQVDRKQLKLKKFNDNMRGELYKGTSWGASTFTNLPSYNNNSRAWSGYEFEYPDEDEITDWNNLYQFTDFVINSSELDFANGIWSKFDENNFIDYFLFLNLIRATDNTGKNIYLGKYKVDKPYFYIPWDLDGCFGTIWNGTNENITNDILGNRFFARVIKENPNNAFVNTANKWFEYRNNIFSLNSLSNSITESYTFLLNNKIYERESLVYSNYSFDNQSLTYTLNWLENRLEFLDIYFGNILSVNSITTSNKLNIYPNPATNRVHINSDGKLNNKNYKIFNSIGQLVSNGTIENNQLKTERLDKGIYHILIDNISFKLIKN